MTNAKITKKDKFNMIKGILEAGTVEGVDVEMLTEFVENEIALLEKKSAKAKETAAAKKAEADELTVAVQAALTDEYATIAEVTAAIEGEDVTTAKVAYRLNALVKAGVAEKAEKTIAGGEGVKSRKVQSYRLASVAEAE
jgi:23S rRNA pseudoU1915 N3-methylase RlmH